MNFSDLKDLTKKLGGLLVMNGDKPELVVLSYDNYLKLDTNQSAMNPVVNEKVLEDLNKEILALKEGIKQKEEAELVLSLNENETMGQDY